MKLLILTEGTQRSGYGHISRMKSVAQAARHLNWSVHVAGIFDDRGFEIIKDFDSTLMPWQNDVTNPVKACGDSDLVIIDSYLASEKTYQKIHGSLSGKTVLACVDDYNRIDYPPCTVLNYSVGATPELYTNQTGQKRYFLGPQYALLSEPFWTEVAYHPKPEAVTPLKITVTLGGADTEHIGLRTAKAIASHFSDFHIHLISPLDGSQMTLDNKCSTVSTYKFMPQNDLRDLFLSSAFCVSAGGHTTYEIGSTGSPMIIVQTAENQRINAAGWRKFGYPVIDSSESNYENHLLHSVHRMTDATYRSTLAMRLKGLIRPDGCLNFLRSVAG